MTLAPSTVSTDKESIEQVFPNLLSLRITDSQNAVLGAVSAQLARATGGRWSRAEVLRCAIDGTLDAVAKSADLGRASGGESGQALALDALEKLDIQLRYIALNLRQLRRKVGATFPGLSSCEAEVKRLQSSTSSIGAHLVSGGADLPGRVSERYQELKGKARLVRDGAPYSHRLNVRITDEELATLKRIDFTPSAGLRAYIDGDIFALHCALDALPASADVPISASSAKIGAFFDRVTPQVRQVGQSVNKRAKNANQGVSVSPLLDVCRALTTIDKSVTKAETTLRHG